MSIMSTADLLVEQMLSWIDQRERCAGELKKLARELESIREKCNASDCVSSSVSVVGAVALLGAGAATLFTGGAAAPLLGIAGGVYTGVGLTISVVTKITEHFLSSDTMKEAQRIEEKSNRIAEKIKKQFQRLKAEVMEVSSFTDPDEVERCVMTEILRAVAKRSGVNLHINKHMFFDDQFFFHQRNMRPDLPVPLLLPYFLGILTFFAFPFNGKGTKLLFAEGVKQLTKELSSIGVKTALKGGAMVVGGAVGLAFALPEAIDNWKDMIKKNHVTEASQSLRNTADEIQKTCRTLRKQFDDMKQMLENVAHVKYCIENRNRSSEDEKKFKKIVTEMSEDEVIVQWLRENSESRLLQLVDMFRFLQVQLDKQKKKTDREDIDIIFVAHGCIEEFMIPASCLLPLHTIKDVLLYSPWNCFIDADAAYGVATGCIRPRHRVFFCTRRGCQIPHRQHWPKHLPGHWNSMKAAEGQEIPNITVSTLTAEDVKEGVWKAFEILQDKHGQPGRNRILIPFILPDIMGEVEVPFFVITFVLSVVLLFTCFRATVHLAACLGERSSATTRRVNYLKYQYAYTIDETAMTTSEEMLISRETNLYRAFKALFD